MNKIAQLSWHMTELLVSKRTLFGELYHITSRTTEEISLFIDELIQAIFNIFKECNIPVGASEDRQRDKRSISRIQIVVQCYNYLLSNTCFPSQKFLKIDFSYRVNIWPNISPYLFIQIIWRLGYDEVLVESLQYISLDFCAEILDITVKYLIELENERAISLIFSLIRRIYYKCLWLDWNVHTKNGKERLYQLVAYFQMLLNLFDQFNQSSEICIQEKYKQHGIFLKRILRHVRLCMSEKLRSNMINPDVTHIADMYRITFGAKSFYNLPLKMHRRFTKYEINSIMITLDQELVTLLLKQIQEINYSECIYWSEIENDENHAISLQRAVAIECRNFMEYMKKDDFLVGNDHLRQFLQQLINWSNFSSPENSKRFSLTLQELRASIVNGKSKNIRKLMKRYKEWDKLTLNFINDRMHLLEKNDIFFFFEYLHHVFANSLNATKRNQAYVSVVTILQRVDNKNLLLNVLKYTKRHFRNNSLECMYDDNVFHNFIENGINLSDPLKLHVLLIYILLNAKKVLTILIKIIIEYNDYEDFTFRTDDLLLLQEFLCIKADKQYNLLLIIVKEISFNNSEWVAENFYNFVTDMLQYMMIKTNDVINYVYIPHLLMTDVENDYSHLEIGLQFIVTELDFARQMNRLHCINYILLIVALTKKMSLVRRNTKWIKEHTNDLLSSVRCILHEFLEYLKTCKPTMMDRKLREYTYTIGNWLEPLDQAQMLTALAPDEISVLRLIQYYETRCFGIHQILRTNPILKYKKRFTYCARINRESLIRHLMLHATIDEFKSYVYDLTEVYYYLGWTSQLEAYENLVRIATEAIQLTIAYSMMFPPNASITLLYTLVKFCKKFAKKSNANSYEAICRILLKALFSLKQLMHGTQYGKLYNYILMHISNMFAYKSYADIEHYFCNIKEWLHVCFGQVKSNRRIIFFEENCKSSFVLNDETNSQAGSNKLASMFNEYNFVCDCFLLPTTEA